MAYILPWLNVTDTQVNQATELAQRFNASEYSPWRRIGYLNTTSRMLKNEWEALKQFHQGTNYYYYNPNNNNNTDEEQARGLFENSIISLIASFDPVISNVFSNLIHIKDRGNEHRQDILSTQQSAGMGYFPKGITDFAPENKIFDDTLSAKIQREIIRENGNDPMLPDNHDDKKITVKVYKDTDYIHFYFNKRSIHTIRRMWYKAIYASWHHLNLGQYCGTDADQVTNIIDNFCYPSEDSAAFIIQTLNKIIERRMKDIDNNLIQCFSKDKQTAMNTSRKQNLESALRDAEHYYNENVRNFAHYANNLVQARKALSEYSEVEFTALADFLTRIKEYPRTKFFRKVNSTTLQFMIEEPMIHTDPKSWSRFLGNSNSDINAYISDFAKNYTSYYNTTYYILRFAAQRLIKETFIDQNIQIYTSALLGIQSDQVNFSVNKYNFSNAGNYMPHPHIATSNLTCWNDAQREITKCIMNNDGETAFLQLTYAIQQMTASDSVVIRQLISMILNSNYRTVTIYLRKGNPDRTSFENIIKEFVQNETDKINAIRETELEREPV